jgi:DNA polymerase-3 subunit alpha
MAGQMSLFDIAGEETKDEFDIKLPDVGEYEKEMLLAFEKEVLGIYVSGHPLEEYQELWQRNISRNTNDFALDEETGEVRVADGEDVTVGGMISDKKIKYTKNNQMMAFINLEDLVGNVEVIVFPRDYEKYASLLKEEAKVFIKGRASVEEDKDAKLICSRIVTFDEAAAGVQKNAGKKTIRKMPAGVWVQFADASDYEKRKGELAAAIADSDGNENVVIFLKDTREIKILPANLQVNADENLLKKLTKVFGDNNVKYVTKPIENQNKKD